MIQNDAVGNNTISTQQMQESCNYSTLTSFCNQTNAPLIEQIGESWVWQNNPADGTSTTPINVTYGSPPNVGLNFTTLSFACHQLTNNNLTLWGSNQNIPNSYPGDAPADTSVVSESKMVASSSGYIENASASSYGTDVGAINWPTTNRLYNLSYDPSTRYWFSNTLGFTFNGCTTSGCWTTPNPSSNQYVVLQLSVVQRAVNTFVQTNSQGVVTQTEYVCVFNGTSIPGGYENSIGQYFASGPNAQTAYVINSSGGSTGYHCDDNASDPTIFYLLFNVPPPSKPPTITLSA